MKTNTTDNVQYMFSCKKQTLCFQPRCYSMARKIQPKMFLKYVLKLKTSTDNNNPDLAIVMQDKGYSGFVRNVMDFNSIFF